MNFTSTQFAAVIETAKAKAANHPEWLRAVEKAAKMLESGELCVTLFADNTALVTSPNGSYRVNGTCPCASRQAHCYHRAAKRLVEMMEEKPSLVSEGFAADVAATPRKQLIVEIKACWPREWPPMADELMRRFRVNYLEALAEDMLRGVLAAIA